MAEENGTTNAGQANAAPTLAMVGQYIRDLSFENPQAPASVLSGGSNPNFSFNISVGYTKQSDEIHSVETTLSVKAERDNAVLFNVELVYGGVFVLRNIPENQVPFALMVQCPAQTFPFARQVVANVIQQGGFPPVLLQPVDFAGLFQQRLQQAQAEIARGNGGGAPGQA
jgi:preprotein translocase subunit SecB